MYSLLGSVLSNVSPGTAATLAYMMLGVVAILLLAGPVVVYIYYRKSRRAASAPQA